MASGEPQFCKVLKPTKEEWSLPFTEYVEAQLKQHKDFAMLKIIPPRGYIARREGFPKLEQIKIQTPIRQHVFGTQGTYRCLLEEQKALSVADFKRLSYSRAHRTPPKGHRQDDLLERAFWSAVTLNPPLYGADTPVSFFDEKVEGWNIKNLGCLLTQHNVPRIPGVTTPMTYFGMWKSFFSWHVEDMDLYSINYMHFGAPKVWYCVSPKDRAKFEAMARAQFPELYRCCPCFLRHKDILISPRVLRNHHIEYTLAKQEAGEFIVLNAGAYHSGFNMGFNCAEAVNFALQQWLPIGRAAEQCDCSALPDGVCLDMVLFRKSRKLREQGNQARPVSTRSHGSAASDASSMSEDTDMDESSAADSGKEREEKESEDKRTDLPALQAIVRQAEAGFADVAARLEEIAVPSSQEASKAQEGARPMLERRHKTAASTALALLSVSARTREAWEAPASARLRKRTTHVLRARAKALKQSAGSSGSKHSRRLASRSPIS
ncbi:hypothetical protein WJX84_000456 [Apatococcus fuscideae]|uniref:JmjC domain-containing protein n=1 Tax=Apatococcus fuscideae TaxID=2026836 RepID=A0AAW1T7P1_9CHLO